MTIPPLSVTADYSKGVLARFNDDVADFEMKVLVDDEVRRHLAFRSPNTGIGWFDITTTHGSLTIAGDMGSFSFRRIEDMFEFFAGNYVNLSYWAEKCVSFSDPLEEFSEAQFKSWAYRDFWENRHEYENVSMWWEALRRHVFPNNPGYAYTNSDAEARTALEFIDEECGFKHYSDSWEVSFHDYSYRYVWNTHAILWGIRAYRAWKQAEAEKPWEPKLGDKVEFTRPIHRRQRTVGGQEMKIWEAEERAQPRQGILVGKRIFSNGVREYHDEIGYIFVPTSKFPVYVVVTDLNRKPSHVHVENVKPVTA